MFEKYILCEIIMFVTALNRERIDDFSSLTYNANTVKAKEIDKGKKYC